MSPTDHNAGNVSSGAMACALRILTRRDHTKKELLAKLHQKGFDRKAIDATLARCEELGYLDDGRTADIMARQMVGKGYGILRIHYALSQKGVDERQIQKALACCGDERIQVRCAQKAMEKRALAWHREIDPKKRHDKVRRFLAGRGFPSDVINQVLDAFWKSDATDVDN